MPTVASSRAGASRFAQLRRLIGGQVAVMLAASVPIGLVLGVLEIVTASILYAVLAEFGLVKPAATPWWLTMGFNPVTALLGLALLTAALRYGSQVLPALSDARFAGRLRDAIVRNVLGGITERKVMSVSETSHLLANAIPRAGEFVNGLTTLAVMVLLIVLILVALLRLSWQITLVVFAFGAVLVLILSALRRLYSRNIELMHAALRQFTGMMIRAARNNHFLRVTGANETAAAELTSISHDHVRASRNYSLVFSLSSNIPAPAAIFLVIGIFWLNIRLSFMPVEGLVPLVYLLSRTGGGISEVSMAVARLQRNWPFVLELLARVDNLFPTADEEAGGAEKPNTILPLKVRGLQFGRDVALATPVDISADRGDLVLISGTSGRGKTTLIMTLIGLIRPLQGALSWGDTPLTMVDTNHLRSKIAYAGSEPYLIDSDIRANLVFGTNEAAPSDARLEKALRMVSADFVFELPGGLSHQLREGGEGISAGQKQRLALARCVLRHPQVLLLDEATSNIDEETEAKIMRRLKAEFPDLMIVAVSHRASLRNFATAEIKI